MYNTHPLPGPTRRPLPSWDQLGVYMYLFIYLMMMGADDVRNYGVEEDIWI
jgi:hypothetical protein